MIDKTSALARNYSNLNNRLSELMRAKGMNMQALANKAEIAVGTIQKLMTDPTCNPTISSLEAICKSLGVSLTELLGQETWMSSLNSASVILLDWDELPITLTNIQNLTENGSKKREIIKTSCSVGKSSFALKMRDNSMLPLFPEDSLLIFDSDKAAKDGSYVLVQIHKYKKIIFKQLLVDDPYKYVKSINPLFKDNAIKLEPADKIIAVLVQSQMQY